jgi:hypothetical protein
MEFAYSSSFYQQKDCPSTLGKKQQKFKYTDNYK